MLRNYLTIATRNIWRYKYLSLLNTAGLIVAFTSALIIVQFMVSELQYDDFHTKKERIFRAYMENRSNLGVSYSSNLLTGAPAVIKGQNPEIESYARVLLGNDYFGVEGKQYQVHYAYADGFLFDIFDFKVQVGDPTDLNSRDRIVFISESLAKRVFGQKNPVGELIRLKNRDHLIAGLLKDIPKNSHLQFEAVIPFNSLPDVYHQFPNSQTSARCYFLLKESEDNAKVERAINQLLDESNYGIRKSDEDFGAKINLQELSDVHLNSYQFIMAEEERAGSITLFIFLGVVALTIVAMAWFNYVNLSLANTLKRGKEVGIKRVIGARRFQVISQFIVESILLMSVTLLCAVTLSQLLTPSIGQLFGTDLVTDLNWSNMIIEWPFQLFLGFVIAITIFSGLYVGFVITSFKAISVLKGNIGNMTKGGSFKKGLVLIQFVIAIIGIVCTYMVQSQINYVLDKDLGVSVEDVVVFRYDRKMSKRVSPQLFKDRLLSYSQISDVTISGIVPGITGNTSRGGVGVAMVTGEDGKKILSDPIFNSKVDEFYLDFYGIELLAGINFSADTDNANKVIINQRYAESLGYSSPEDAINRSLDRNKIIGVTNNFHHQSLKKELMNIKFGYERTGRWATYSVRLNEANRAELLPQIEEDWKEIFETDIFEYTILEDHIDDQYLSDTKFSQMISIVAFIVLIITTLGLIGITHLSVIHSLKEIGIRKILGATKWNVIRIFSKGYVLMLLLAVAIASPVAGHLFGRWIQDFVFRVEVSTKMYLLPTGLMILVAMIILLLQGLKSFRVRPIDTLRIE